MRFTQLNPIRTLYAYYIYIIYIITVYLKFVDIVKINFNSIFSPTGMLEL